MTKYISKPQVIEAFQFKPNEPLKFPDWFAENIILGNASFTINSKAQYITIDRKNQVELAYDGDWVCLSEHGKIFVLDSENFTKYWGVL